MLQVAPLLLKSYNSFKFTGSQGRMIIRVSPSQEMNYNSFLLIFLFLFLILSMFVCSLFSLNLNSVRNWHKTLLLRQPMKTCHVVICLFSKFLSYFLDFVSLSVPSELSLLASFFFFFPFSIASNPLLFPILIHASTQWQWAFKSEIKKRARKQAHQPQKVRAFNL